MSVCGGEDGKSCGFVVMSCARDDISLDREELLSFLGVIIDRSSGLSSSVFSFSRGELFPDKLGLAGRDMSKSGVNLFNSALCLIGVPFSVFSGQLIFFEKVSSWCSFSRSTESSLVGRA